MCLLRAVWASVETWPLKVSKISKPHGFGEMRWICTQTEFVRISKARDDLLSFSLIGWRQRHNSLTSFVTATLYSDRFWTLFKKCKVACRYYVRGVWSIFRLLRDFKLKNVSQFPSPTIRLQLTRMIQFDNDNIKQCLWTFTKPPAVRNFILSRNSINKKYSLICTPSTLQIRQTVPAIFHTVACFTARSPYRFFFARINFPNLW